MLISRPRPVAVALRLAVLAACALGALAPSAASAGAASEAVAMDAVRERLAAKLGAASGSAGANSGGSTGGLKVQSSRAAASSPTNPAAHAARSPISASLSAVGRNSTGAVPTSPSSAPPRHAAPPARAAAGHWAYEGETGPAAWGRLSPDNATCASGQRQSPIDISDGFKVDLDAVQFDYRPGTFRVIDNGHTVQVNVAAGNTIEVTGKRYELLQFHFHRPAEERIDGKPFDMVAHLVHRSADGKLAVVAVLLERGSAQPVVQAIWNNLPLEQGDEVSAKGDIDLSTLLPTDRRYYTYMGSLTTPPCSEGVLWMVMKTPVQISPEQLHIFSRLYPMNARPIQSVRGRVIKESN